MTGVRRSWGCRSCGVPLEKGDVYCGACGAPAPTSRVRARLVVTALGAGLAIVVLAAALLVTRDEDQTGEMTTSTTLSRAPSTTAVPETTVRRRPTTTEPSTTTTTTSPPVTTRPPVDSCARVSADLSSAGGRAGIVEGLCTDGWALVDTCVDCLGDTWVVARFDGSRWSSFLGFPTSVCADTARSEGIPGTIIDRIVWPDCAPTTTTAVPASPPPAPDTDCGTTGPDWGEPLQIIAVGITCERAAEVLAAYLAAPNKEGSDGVAQVLGFECWSDALPTPSPGDVTGGCDGDEGAVELRIM